MIVKGRKGERAKGRTALGRLILNGAWAPLKTKGRKDDLARYARALAVETL